MKRGSVHHDLEVVLQSLPPENRGVVRAIAEHLDLVRFEKTSGYIKATRREKGPDLHIAYGWVNGFRSREEAAAATAGMVPDDDIWHSDRAKKEGLVGVTLPENRVGGTRRHRQENSSNTSCPTCGYVLPAIGICDNCD